MVANQIFAFFRKDPCKDAYTLGRQLGTGSFATVKRGTCKRDGSAWAIKIIKKRALSSADRAFLQKEVDVMEQLAKLNHPNIVALREVFDGSANFYMVMELCSGGEVFDRIVEQEYYTETQAKLAIAQIASALKCCHERGIVHRDLKPENLLYATERSDVIKLADFGLSNILDNDKLLATACGTPGYVAPEVLQRTGYSKEVDIWSLGIIAYILLCGCPPFYDENQARLFVKIKRGEFHYPSPFWDQVSDGAKNFVDRLLVVSPKKRASAADILKDPWIVDVPTKVEAAKEKELVGFQANMVQYNARRKFKAGIMKVQTINFLSRHFGSTVENLLADAKEDAEAENEPLAADAKNIDVAVVEAKAAA